MNYSVCLFQPHLHLLFLFYSTHMVPVLDYFDKKINSLKNGLSVIPGNAVATQPTIVLLAIYV